MTIINKIKRLFKNLRGGSHVGRYDIPMPAPSGLGRVRNLEFSEYYAVPSSPGIAGTLNGYSIQQTVEAAREMPKDLREEKKPVEIVKEIIAKKPEIQTGDLKTQIKIVEARLKILKKHGGQTSDELLALRYLNARRKFAKTEKLFEKWPITTDEMIQNLVNKYKVMFVPFGAYSKSIPIEATNEIEKFSNAWEKVVDEDRLPQLMLITDYKGKEHKKDPILLAESPYGAWWHILGAWDKEVEIVDDLVYAGK